MTTEILDVRLEGYDTPIGNLVRENDGCYFVYADDYIGRSEAIPISLSLPFNQRVYGDQTTRAFFDNLLPENNLLEQTMARERLARDDIVGLLKHLGSDCPGAISCLPLGSQPIKVPGNSNTDYTELTRENVEEIMQRLAEKLPLPDEMRDPSPIAGVQRKVALTEIGADRFGIPQKNLKVPSTHILKVPERGREREVLQEAIAARLAAISIEHPVALPAEFIRGNEVGLLIKRFDRHVSADGLITRIHQEDFCQALGLPSLLKYERKGSPERGFSAQNVSDMLTFTDEPGLNRRKFIQITLFNLAIGNTDNHAKNHALIYDQGKTPRLAPLYDMLPIRLYNRFTHELAFKIGNAEHFDQMKISDLHEFMRICGLRTDGAIKRFCENDLSPMLSTIDAVAEELTSRGQKDFDDLIGREIRKLSALLGLPLNLRERDYFEPGGGGWGAMS